MFKLSIKESRLLCSLYSNSRASAKELSQLSGFTHSFVLKKIIEFKNQDTVSCFFANIDYSRFGYTAYRVEFYFEQLSKEKIFDIIEYFETRKNILKIELLDKDFGMSIFLVARNYNELRNLLSIIMRKFGLFIKSNNVFPINIHEFYELSYLKNNAFRSTKPLFSKSPNCNPLELDKLDYQILSQLNVDSRKSIVAISKTMNIPPKTVAYRIKRLEDNLIILGYSSKIVKNSIGYKSFRINIKTINPVDEVLSFARLHPNVVEFEESTPFDYSLVIDVSSMEELTGIINAIIERFANIKSYSYSYIASVRKDSVFMP
jgi:DNA-binding Lrp family transcriptional regulator